MLELINRGFVALLIAIALAGMLISFVTLVPSFFNLGLEKSEFADMSQNAALSLSGLPPSVQPEYSPHSIDLTIATPPLEKEDLVYVEAYANEKQVSKTDCLQELGYAPAEYVGLDMLDCKVSLPYGYNPSEDYNVYAVLHTASQDYYSGPYRLSADWMAYEGNFWGAYAILLLATCLLYLIVVLPVALVTLYEGMKTSHPNSEKGEYTLYHSN